VPDEAQEPVLSVQAPGRAQQAVPGKVPQQAQLVVPVVLAVAQDAAAVLADSEDLAVLTVT
jgi:hypothetical protein